MKRRNMRWGVMAGVAGLLAIGFITADAAEAKVQRGTRPGSTASRAGAPKATIKKKAQAQAKSRKNVATRARKSSVARNHAAANRRVAAARRPARDLRRASRSAPLAVLDLSPAYPSKDVLDLALRAYACGEAEGQFEQPYLTIIDYSLPSNARRLWVIDVRTRRVLFHELVAHGRNSGETMAVAFSNAPGSYQSSLGLYRTDEIYSGQHGSSLRLTGLEPGYNDLAWDRAIVMHGARYVSTSHLAQYGKVGRSLGCPALPLGVHQRIIERIQGGSAVFAYYPDRSWLRSSRYLHCNARLAQR